MRDRVPVLVPRSFLATDLMVARPLKIVYFVAPSPHFAGIERTVHEIASGMVEAKGFDAEIHVVFASRYDEAQIRDTAYRQHVLGVDRLLAVPGRLRAVLRSIRPDVLICPQVEASVIGWVASRGLGVRGFFAHFHGNPVIEERDGTRRTKWAFRFFRRIVAPRSQGLLAVSPSLAEYLRRSFGSAVPIRFVPNPVRELSSRSVAGEATRPFVFVTVGRLSVQKGQDVLLQAVAHARALGADDFRVRIVGEGSERTSLQQLCARLALEDVVEFEGYAPDPSSHLSVANCFVLASRWEGFGVVLIEALQFGLPLVATDCEFGPSDIIQDQRIGILVPSESPEHLGEALVEMQNRPGLSEDVAYRRRAASRYGRDVAVVEHIRALQDFVGVASADVKFLDE